MWRGIGQNRTASSPPETQLCLVHVLMRGISEASNALGGYRLRTHLLPKILEHLRELRLNNLNSWRGGPAWNRFAINSVLAAEGEEDAVGQAEPKNHYRSLEFRHAVQRLQLGRVFHDPPPPRG